MKNKSSESIALAICIILGLSLNATLSSHITKWISKILITELNPINRTVQICNKDLGAFGGIAKIVSDDLDSIVYEAVNVRKKDCIFYCKDIVTWKVKDSKIVDVDVNQTKTGFNIMNNTGIEEIKADSSENMRNIVAKHNITMPFGDIATPWNNVIISQISESTNTDYKCDFTDYWTIFPDGRYYIKTEF